jgi:type I restriction-modification system DNA methylase subunit
MARSARKTKTIPNSDAQLQLLYADDAISKYWSSSLFNTVYLRHDISDKHSCWKNDDDLDFQNFMNTLRNIAAEYKNREKELSNWSETETINNWVKHVLHALGWTNNCTGVQNPFLEETSFRYDNKTYRTDILIVDHPKEKQYVNQAKGDDKLKEARQSILMPVEVKYWQRLEEYRQGKKEEKGRTDNESDDIARTTTPNEQMIQYMDILKKNWGVLTDGARWRLFNAELSSEDAERYYEFNFSALFQAMTTEESELDSLEILAAAKYFYHFFSKFAFYPKNEAERPFVDEVLQYSKKYVNKVEEELKARFVKAMNIACNGLFKSSKVLGQTQDLAVLRNVAESTLFNILFIKSLESRNILPMSSTDYKKISISSIVDKIEKFDPEREDMLNFRELERAFRKGNGNSFLFNTEDTELHDRILRLTGVIHKGATAKDNFGFEIGGFRQSIFSNSEWDIFKTCKIGNLDWVRILFELGYAESESLNRKYQQIPYSYFTPRQLGSIYESFLEYKLDKANSNMIYEKKQWKEVELNSKKYKNSDLPTVRKGELFFTPDNMDRRASGSYYTPDNVVQFMVENCFSEVLQKLSANEILTLKVCDPAMGSGHFLVSALRCLARAYLQKSDSDDISQQQALAQVLHSCIFGVDLNPRAVKLAKMSLWLATASANRKLEDLSDQLKCGDSVSSTSTFDWKNSFTQVFEEGGFNFIVGNPPYFSLNSIENGQNEIKEKLQKRFPASFSGNSDIYFYFIALAPEILKRGGRLSFIVSRSFLEAKFASNLRAHLSLNTTVDHIIDFGNCFVFEDASISTAIINLTNEGKTESFKVYKYLQEEMPETINDKFFSLCESFEVNIDDPSQTWTKGFKSDQYECYRLGELAEIAKSMETGKNDVFTISASEAKKHNIERDLLFKIAKSGSILAFKNDDKERVLIWTYKIDIKKYPNALKYLSKFKDVLAERYDIKSRKANWWEPSNPRNAELFLSDRERMLVPYIAKNNRFYLDKDNHLNDGGDISGIFLNRDCEISGEYICAILNSKLLEDIHHSMAKLKAGGAYEYYNSVLEQLPIPKLQLELKSHKTIYNQIIQISKKAQDKGLSENDSKQLDKLVESAFELIKKKVSMKKSA